MSKIESSILIIVLGFVFLFSSWMDQRSVLNQDAIALQQKITTLCKQQEWEVKTRGQDVYIECGNDPEKLEDWLINTEEKSRYCYAKNARYQTLDECLSDE